jgi:hypothetical protein
VDVQNLGLVQTAYGPKHKVRIVWQLGQIDEEHGRRYDVARVYTLSLHERAALRKDLESWRGRKFTEIELSQGFDLERLVGVPAQIQVTHDLSDEGVTFANVSTVLPPAKGVPRLTVQDYVRAKDRQPRPGAPPPSAPDEDPVPF